MMKLVCLKKHMLLLCLTKAKLDQMLLFTGPNNQAKIIVWLESLFNSHDFRWGEMALIALQN